VQVWLPGGDDHTQAAVVRALLESFPHVRAFDSIEGWGTHFLVSLCPLPATAVEQLPQPLPPAAARDLVEWEADSSPARLLATVLSQEEPVENFLDPAPHVPAIQDDRPINEYFLLRQTWPRLGR
jgi:hypothetical protein